VSNEEIAEGAKTQAVVPIRQQIVDFYGDAIVAGQTADATIYVPLRPICEALGLDWSGQAQRIRRDEVLADAQVTVLVKTSGGDQRMLALPLDLLPGWLFGISTTRVKPELAPKIARYRRECFRVLWDAFKADILPAEPAPSGASGAALALEFAEAITALARQQLAIEGRLAGVEGRVDTMADYLRGYIVRAEQRVDALELRLSEGATISEAEAAELALHVKTVAAALEAEGRTNGYQRVYSELYRRFRIAGYKNLPRARYQEALTWLDTWHQELEGRGTP
jgi:hypothetical protein